MLACVLCYRWPVGLSGLLCVVPPSLQLPHSTAWFLSEAGICCRTGIFWLLSDAPPLLQPVLLLTAAGMDVVIGCCVSAPHYSS
jgi:hypothetical protein